MQYKIKATLFATICSITVIANADDLNMNPGLWEWTANIHMPSAPVQIPPTVNRKCLTRDDLVPAAKQPGQKCDIKDLKTSSNRVTWGMTCTTPQGPVASIGEMNYQGDTAHGKVEVNTQGMLITSNMSGKRIGPCNK